MDVALKIWRFDPESGKRALRDYEVDAPEWACLLDVLDLIKDKHDGTLAYRKSCRMMICGSCGMRMDGAAVLACKTRMKPLVDEGRVPVVSAMGNLPIVRDLVVDMQPFWSKFRGVGPWLRPGYSADSGSLHGRASQTLRPRPGLPASSTSRGRRARIIFSNRSVAETGARRRRKSSRSRRCTRERRSQSGQRLR